MPYWNVTGIANRTTDVLTFSREVNDQLLFGWAFIGIHVMFTIIIFVAAFMSTNDAYKASLAAAWQWALGASMLWIAGLVPWWWAMMGIFAGAMALIFAVRKE
jgi:hypothetical protein